LNALNKNYHQQYVCEKAGLGIYLYGNFLNKNFVYLPSLGAETSTNAKPETVMGKHIDRHNKIKKI